ncbi:hypothetical protein BDW62DRAFT_177308 [Aspergillus aurantiobrunneus]
MKYVFPFGLLCSPNPPHPLSFPSLSIVIIINPTILAIIAAIIVPVFRSNHLGPPINPSRPACDNFPSTTSHWPCCTCSPLQSSRLLDAVQTSCPALFLNYPSGDRLIFLLHPVPSSLPF